MHVEQNPQSPDELTTRLMGLREVSAGIVLPSGARIREAGTMRRRRRTLVTVTSAALAAAAVAFLVTNPSDRRQAVPPPPATQVPVSTTATSATSENAETLKVGGNPNLILPRDRVDPLLFVSPEVWADTGLGSGREIAWRAPSDSYPYGLDQVYPCDLDGGSAGKVGQVDLATDRDPLGRLRVRELGSGAKARAFYEDAVETLAGCQETRAGVVVGTDLDLTVRRFDRLGLDTGERAMKVYEFNDPIHEPPLIDHVAVGYTASGRFMAVRVNGSALAGALKNTGPEVVAQIGEASLDRLATVRATATATTSTPVTSGSAETLKLGGRPNLILPHDQVDPLLFLEPKTWSDSGLGAGREIEWEAVDGGDRVGVGVNECDTDDGNIHGPVGSVGAVGLVGFVTDNGEKHLGEQKVRDPGTEAKARGLHQDAVKAMGDCAERVAVELPGLLEITVRDISPEAAAGEDRTVAVYELTNRLVDETPDIVSVEYVTFGYTANGRFTTIRLSPVIGSSKQRVGALAVQHLADAALDRLLAAP